MLSSTFKEYTNNYKSSLLTYLKEYEDNTASTFFLKELEEYKTYHQILVDLKELILPFFEDDSIPVEIDAFQAVDLKRINENAYNQFITDEDNTRYLYLIDGKWKDVGPEDSSLVEFYKLKNFINSSIRIIDFISIELEKSKLNDKLGFEIPGRDLTSLGENEANNKDINDFKKSTIIEYLEDIKEDFINPADFNILANALYHYFSKGELPKLNQTINFKRINKKKVGWALKEVYKNLKREDLHPEYFRFAKENINLFDKEIIETSDFNKSKFYKLFTTNPAK